jgi:hypothetical protein
MTGSEMVKALLAFASYAPDAHIKEIYYNEVPNCVSIRSLDPYGQYDYINDEIVKRG